MQVLQFQSLGWLIHKKFLSKQSSVKHLFTSFTSMKRLFHVMIFEMVISCLSVFKLDALSTIDFAIRSGYLSESRSFVPTWRTKWYGYSLKDDFKYSFMQRTLAPEKCLTVPPFHLILATFSLSVLQWIPTPDRRRLWLPLYRYWLNNIYLTCIWLYPNHYWVLFLLSYIFSLSSV